MLQMIDGKLLFKRVGDTVAYPAGDSNGAAEILDITREGATVRYYGQTITLKLQKKTAINGS